MKDLGELDLAVSRQLDGLADGVDEPAQDDLASAPATVSFEKLLQGDGAVGSGAPRLLSPQHPTFVYSHCFAL